MSATYEGMSPGGHETYATSIFSKIKTYLDSNPYGYVSKSGDTMTGNLIAPKFIGALQGNADTASKLGSFNVGSATQPIYLNAGTATACTYTLGKSVPSDAVFTDHYAWTDITGKPTTFTPSTHYHYELKTIGDQRATSTTPNTYKDRLIFQGLKTQSYIGNPGGTSGYSYLLGLRGWGDSSGGDAHELAFNNKGVYYRHGATTTWNDWVKIFTSADTYTGTLTSSQVTTALGFTPASVNTTYDFESSDNSISFMGRAVGSVETVDMTVNGKVSTEGDTISGDYINTANFIEAGVTGKRVTTYGPWGIDIDEYVGTSLWSKLALRDSDILLTKTWDGTHDSLKATIAYLGSQSAVNKVDKAGDTMSGALIMSTANFAPSSGKDSTLTAGTSKLYKNGLVISNPATANDQGWIRVLGTAESDTILEIATGDDGGTGEQIVARQYNTSNAVAHQVILLDTAGNFRCGNTTIYSSGSNGGRNSMLVGDDCKLGDCNVGGMLGLQAASGTNCGIRLYNSSGSLIGGFQSSNGTPQWINSKGTATTISLNGHGHSYLPLSGGTLTGNLIVGSGTATKMVRCTLYSRVDTGDSGYCNFVNNGNSAYTPIRASGFVTMSCKHVKTNVKDISDEEAKKLLNIRPVNFDYIEEVGGLKDQIGVLAEDTYEILPKVVSIPDDYVEEDLDVSKGIQQPLPSVDYAKFVPYLIKMVQMQQKEIDILKKERT